MTTAVYCSMISLTFFIEWWGGDKNLTPKIESIPNLVSKWLRGTDYSGIKRRLVFLTSFLSIRCGTASNHNLLYGGNEAKPLGPYAMVTPAQQQISAMKPHF